MKPPKIFAFDIETGGLPPERIREIAPPFRDEAVKVGNLGIEKAVEKINAAKIAHFDRIEREAALNAEYGEVLAIGYTDGTSPATLTGKETDLLTMFWVRLSAAINAGRYKELWAGHNCAGFDLPFLLRRSYICGVSPPVGLLERGRYWADIFVDTMELFAAGEYRRTISLDRFCKACGLEGKTGSGAHFAETFASDPEAALEYLRNDLRITHALASRVVPLARPELFPKGGTS